jgi:hypothetical protein
MWTEAERLEFIAWIAANPTAGDLIPGADGARKLRWAVRGKGTRSGVRVVCFNLSDDELVLLVAVYAKADRANILSNEIERK